MSDTYQPTDGQPPIPTLRATEPEVSITRIDAAPAPKFDPGHADESADEQERQKAFDAEFAWEGKRLRPFTSSRLNLFSQQRLAMGAPPLFSCIDDSEGFEADACRILWICTHTDEDWAILRASPSNLQLVIDRWSDIHVPPNKSGAASTLCIKIYLASRRNEHETAPVREGNGDDSGN